MSRANPTWGAPRIHGELLKLGIEIGETSVGKYMVRKPKTPSQTWRTFLTNHANEFVSIDLFTVPTVTFRILFVLVVLSNNRTRIVHFNVTESPTARWIGQQMVEAFPWEEVPKYLVRDRDGAYGHEFVRRVDSMGIEQVVTSPRSPWQNAYVERVIGSVRREYLDHVITFGEGHLKRVLRDYMVYCHGFRTHLGLKKDCPIASTVEPPGDGSIASEAMVGGLHHRYFRRAA